MAIAAYLVDTSALARLKDDDVAEVIRPLVKRGLTAFLWGDRVGDSPQQP